MQKILIFAVTFLVTANFQSTSYADLASTHTTTIQLFPISEEFVNMKQSYQTAKVCFLAFGGCDKNENFEFPTEDCTLQGYTKTSCTPPEYLTNPCPMDAKYYKNCEIDIKRACEESGYFQQCPEGQVLDTSQLCPYDKTYGKCVCDPCVGYDFTYEEATITGYSAGESCKSCDEIKYRRISDSCSGYFTCECGPEIGATSCNSGETIMYSACKSCCQNKCKLDICPSGYICELESCSGKYCQTGCANNRKDLDNYWCNGAMRYWFK